MSEYQFYEFRAIDRPLTEDQKRFVCSLSSRANITSHSASFVYQYGDFRGNVKNLMTDYFDAMMYMANWGSRRLIFRIPWKYKGDLEEFQDHLAHIKKNYFNRSALLRLLGEAGLIS